MIRKIIFTVFFMGFSIYLIAQDANSFTDLRDGETYKTVKIGNQVWMAQNLNYEAENSYCYADKPENCKKFGRLYEWDAAIRSCPDGWRLPADSDWVTLVTTLGGSAGAGVKMNIYGKSGFKGLFAGRRVSNGEFSYMGSLGVFWSSTEVSGDKVVVKTLAPGNADLLSTNYDKYNAYSTRCIKGKGTPPPQKQDNINNPKDSQDNKLDDGDNENKDHLFK
jgi:uncharacterized protein (TIGR02145 family)